MQDDGDVFGEEAVAGGALVEIERLAFAQNGDAGHMDIDARGIEGHSGAAGGGENAAPVRIASGEGGLDEGRGGDGFGDALGGSFSFGAANFDFDDALGAFAVGYDLEG